MIFHTLFRPNQNKKAKTIPYFRLRQLKNHTLKCGTYPYNLYMGVPPPPGGFTVVICGVVGTATTRAALDSQTV